MSRLILVLISLVLSFNVLAAGDSKDSSEECVELLLKKNEKAVGQFLDFIKNSGKAKTPLKEHQAVWKVAEFITKKKKFPTPIETVTLMGAAYKIPFADLSKTDQNRIREELIISAMAEYEEARDALIERVGVLFFKQFSKDYTTPKITELAEAVGSTGTQLVSLLYGNVLKVFALRNNQQV